MSSLSKAIKKVVGKKGYNALKTAGTVTGFLPATEAATNVVNKITGNDTTNNYGGDTLLNVVNSLFGASGTNLGTLLGNITGNSNIGNTLGTVLGNIDWGNSVFSAKQAKDMAKWNSELNYKYQTKLNQQGFSHDKEMLGLQQAYDERMANTAVQRQMADLSAAGVNPAMATSLGGAGGGAVAGGSGQSGGTAQTDKANWLQLQLEKMAAERDAERVRIENSNSASTASLMSKQEEQINSNIAKTIAEIPWIGKRNQAEIASTLAQAGKNHAETAEAQARTDKTKQGLIANILGTDASNKTKALLGAGVGLIPGVGIGYKAYKGAKAVKGFSSFLKTIK